ncbi:hypothetical protein [Burkholderia stabilis]|uniref:hypothetical protein n=1 Tax=Burkholderia stabilis TaxID=95485 RepID=UPI001F4AA943|nr:hypothetical protein [Burkholderia stabilis]
MGLDAPGPAFGRNGFRDLGQIGDFTAGRPVANGFQQAQDRYVEAMAFARGAYDRFDFLPPRDRDRHRRQATDHRAIRRDQHQPRDARRRRRWIEGPRDRAHFAPDRRRSPALPVQDERISILKYPAWRFAGKHRLPVRLGGAHDRELYDFT